MGAKDMLYYVEIMMLPIDIISSFVVLYYLKKLFFFEHHTARQRETIKKLFFGFGVWGLICELLTIVMLCRQSLKVNNGRSVYEEFYSSIIIELLLLGGVVGIGILLYSSVTGRRKAKWIGVFSVIPIIGYSCTLDAVVSIPVDNMNVFSPVQGELYQGAAFSVISVVFLLLNAEKTKPRFLRKMEEMEQYEPSFWTQAGIWLVGLWLLIFDILKPAEGASGIGFFADMSQETLAYLDLSNFIIGIIITALIINANYRRFYSEKNVQLQKTLINTMANLVESRDGNTGGHIHRTAKYVEIIARRLREQGKFPQILTERYIEDMIVAAPLHDVGKIHIPDAILNKPGRLDAEEFDTMKTHSAAGGEIIHQVEDEAGEVSYLEIAKEMAEYHHERMDGKGYPHGLKGDEIPVCARILAVADVFDALISKRCYKEALPPGTAFAIIEEETGDHFDRDVAEAFLSAREEVEAFLEGLEE